MSDLRVGQRHMTDENPLYWTIIGIVCPQIYGNLLVARCRLRGSLFYAETPIMPSSETTA
ncbi:hypothetical protein G8O24_04405 [Bradyrhizobium sp. INPA01-394B]|uniref:Uncharacterized protein n=1 Tax=Bradyrhizobium campsiandrae TaxID=1729892 RepID=A0ABR7U8X4_9BRAD|nr:hypothetical protein [Bradyrhizobium campsiandrae]MBC9876591.1 hypothetical protein [Bradyrhizobium campsiandrae]MBC9979847.1 hypothetical protein [Bradyrhizobium campsiandrae]